MFDAEEVFHGDVKGLKGYSVTGLKRCIVRIPGRVLRERFNPSTVQRFNDPLNRAQTFFGFTFFVMSSEVENLFTVTSEAKTHKR
jgi:hypothetical protein